MQMPFLRGPSYLGNDRNRQLSSAVIQAIDCKLRHVSLMILECICKNGWPVGIQQAAGLFAYGGDSCQENTIELLDG